MGKYLAVARDTHSPFMRNTIWVVGIRQWGPDFGLSNVRIGIVSRENNIAYVSEETSWDPVRKELFETVKDDLSKFEDYIDNSLQVGEEMNAFTEQIMTRDLAACAPSELIAFYREFAKRQSNAYACGCIIPLIDIGGQSLIEGRGKEYLQQKMGDRFQECYDAFTFPIRNSFAGDQEEELLELYKEILAKELQPVLQGEPEEIVPKLQQGHPEFYTKLVAHTKKYSWVYYVYAGPAYTEKDFVAFLQDYLARNVDPAAELKRRAQRRREVEQRKEHYLKQLKPDKFMRHILQLMGKIVWAKPRRKDLQSKSYWHIERLLLEIGKRLGIQLDEVRNYTIDELEAALEHQTPLDHKAAAARKHLHVCITEPAGIQLMVGKEAEQWIESTMKTEEAVSASEGQLRGTPACLGAPVTGTVKVINDPSEMGKMSYGDILVSVVTTPSIVPAMKKAAAIVTDEGGLTCHAAIVSRELNIPCVVGTQRGTATLKDGDQVEVDASEGTVRILDHSL